MFFRKAAPAPQSAEEKLQALVSQTLPGADAATVQIVAACAGLLACVGFADRDYTDAERVKVRTLLTRIDGVSEEGAGKIDEFLRSNVRELATVQTPRFTRALRDLAERELRMEVLSLLMEVAAADGVVSVEEVTVMRQLTTAMGLDQQNYNAVQAAHRDKLAALKSPR